MQTVGVVYLHVPERFQYVRNGIDRRTVAEEQCLILLDPLALPASAETGSVNPG